MEWNHEEVAQESSRRGPRQVGRLSPELGQKAGEPPRKWSQGRLAKNRKKRIARRNARRPRSGRRRKEG